MGRRHGWNYAIIWLATPNSTEILWSTATYNYEGRLIKPTEKVGDSIKLVFVECERLIYLTFGERKGSHTLPLIM